MFDTADPRRIRAMQAPGVLDMMQSRNITNPHYTQRLVHYARTREVGAKYQPLTDADIKLSYDDVYTGLPWIKPASVHAIITDPPYARDYVPIYAAIARLAVRVLVPQGVLVIMTGQSHLDKIIRTIANVDGLVYHWLISYITRSAGSTYLNQIGVAPYHKPILLYIKGSRHWKGRDIFSDVIDTPPDKDRQTCTSGSRMRRDFASLCAALPAPAKSCLTLAAAQVRPERPV
jgi:hypothetical protein